MDSLPQIDTPPPVSRVPGVLRVHNTNNALNTDKVFSTLDSLIESQPRQPARQSGTLDAAEKMRRNKSLEALQYRRWKQGDVYAPHDLSPAEMKKWRQRSRRAVDVFDVLAINPINEYKVRSSFALTFLEYHLKAFRSDRTMP